MAEFSKTTQKRITFLSVFETLEGDYDASMEVIERLEQDGFFEEESASRGGGRGNGRSSGRSGGSGKRGSGSKSSSRGSNRRGGGGNAEWRDDPATDKQIEKAIDVGALEDGYSEDELADMTKGEISDLIDNLK